MSACTKTADVGKNYMEFNRMIDGFGSDQGAVLEIFRLS